MVFAPEALDADVHRKLLRGLDPDGARDVLLIAFDRPRDAIEAIERATGRLGPRPTRARPSRLVLAHPTMVEAKLDVGRWWRPVLAGTATVSAMAAALIISAGVPVDSIGVPDDTIVAVTPPRTAPTTATTRISDGITLAAVSRAPLRDLDEDADDDLHGDLNDRAWADPRADDGLTDEGDAIVFLDETPLPQRAAADAATDALYQTLASPAPNASTERAQWAEPSNAAIDDAFDTSVLRSTTPLASAPSNAAPTKPETFPAPVDDPLPKSADTAVKSVSTKTPAAAPSSPVRSSTAKRRTVKTADPFAL